MAKTFFYIIMTLILVIGMGYFMIEESAAIQNTASGSNGKNFQEVTLSIKNYNYYPNTVKVKANESVRIYLDKTVVGCYRSFTIRDFGISKYLPTPNDYVEFTPTKKGTYSFACSMGMGTGTLIVE